MARSTAARVDSVSDKGKEAVPKPTRGMGVEPERRVICGTAIVLAPLPLLRVLEGSRSRG